MANINGTLHSRYYDTFVNDTLVGTDDHDWITGFGGDDIIYGNRGHDIMVGGAGDDVITATNLQSSSPSFYGTGDSTGPGVGTVTTRSTSPTIPITSYC